MASEKKFERNDLGDIMFPKITEELWKRQQERQYTYVFHKHLEGNHFIEVDLINDLVAPKGKKYPKIETTVIEIFKSPDNPPWDNHIKLMQKNEALLQAFLPIFEKPSYRSSLKIDKYRIIVDKQWYKKFAKFINDFNLNDFHDLLLYITAKIEEIYIDDIAHSESPEMKQRIRKLPKEVDQLAVVLKKTSREEHTLDSKNETLTLSQISFYFKERKEPIKITDPLLTSTVTDSTRTTLDGYAMKNWEKQLRAFPQVFDDNEQPNEFRYRVCKAIHNFFRASKAFDFKSQQTTDKEMSAIAHILDFAHVKFYGKNMKQYNIETDRQDLIKIVRNHTKRKSLEYSPTHVSANTIKPDFDKLRIYFDETLIKSSPKIYPWNLLQATATISGRFEVNPVLKELIHIASCLDAFRSIVGHQFEAPFYKEEITKVNDYNSTKTLLDALKSGKKIEELSLKIDGIDLTFTDKLFKQILGKALLDFHKSNKEEFEVDFVRSEIEILNGGFKAIPTGSLQNPEDRFLPKFVKGCFDFLLKEMTPTESEWSPSEKYYQIIAHLLVEASVITDQDVVEDTIQKVKYWHSLTRPVN